MFALATKGDGRRDCRTGSVKLCSNTMNEKIEMKPKRFEKFDYFLHKFSGIHLSDISLENLITWMYRPTDPSSLGVCRLLFGIMMMLDCTSERGGGDIDLRWGEPRICHFPLFPQLQPLSFPYMALIYGFMWLGAVGIASGYKFKLSSFTFAICYWYIILLDKSFWNNHSYLFGLVSILLIWTEANHYLSLDAYYDKTIEDVPVPYWNYFILKYQFFILYFVAGLKKGNFEWLSGYSMRNLSSHWVFDPLTIFFSTNLTDYLFVHWFAFLFDLTICFWMMYEKTRPMAMILCSMFHFMNSRLFTIGMFPWVCLCTMPLFCSADWPKKVFGLFKAHNNEENENTNVTETDEMKSEKSHTDKTPECSGPNQNQSGKKHSVRQKIVLFLIFIFMFIQGFLPYSHFITKGYNNWTNGLYGYSWDMMVHSWDTVTVSIKVIDNESGREMFLDPESWTINDRWSKHGDMVYQYAHCIYNNLINDFKNPPDYNIKPSKEKKYKIIYDVDVEEQHHNKKPDAKSSFSTDLSIYVDVWCSMNYRFQQRMFDPMIDLLEAKWSPFEEISWLMPLLTEFSDRRQKIDELQEHVYSWNKYSNALFVADFPGLSLENFVTKDLSNVTLTILEGQIVYEAVDKQKKNNRNDISQAIQLTKGDSLEIKSGVFHKIHTVGSSPSSFMYTYMNATKKAADEKGDFIEEPELGFNVQHKLPLTEEIFSRLKQMGLFIQHVGNAILHFLYGVPMMRRIPI